MHDQTTSAVPGLVNRIPADGLAVEDLGEHPVAVLSSAVLTLARRGYRETRADFALRAGVAPDVVAGAEE